MSDKSTCRVLVTPLGSKPLAWTTVSWRDSVNRERRFYHPIGQKGWPAEPVKWLGFRYDARLQSVHPVESCLRVNCRSELSKIFPDIDGDAMRLAFDGGTSVPHFVYRLGPPITPERVIPAGRLFQATKVWAYLDLLLDSSSISEAARLSRLRDEGGPGQPSSGGDVADTFIMPPIDNAESLIARIRQLPGLPERNHEDVVRDLLFRLGHGADEIVFQVGRIDVSVLGAGRKTRAVIEVKRSISSSAEAMGARRQGMDYACQSGAPFVVVTDGDRYEIYDRRRSNYDEMLLGRFQLSAFVEGDAAVLDFLRPSFLRDGLGGSG